MHDWHGKVLPKSINRGVTITAPYYLSHLSFDLRHSAQDSPSFREAKLSSPL